MAGFKSTKSCILYSILKCFDALFHFKYAISLSVNDLFVQNSWMKWYRFIILAIVHMLDISCRVLDTIIGTIVSNYHTLLLKLKL